MSEDVPPDAFSKTKKGTFHTECPFHFVSFISLLYMVIMQHDVLF